MTRGSFIAVAILAAGLTTAGAGATSSTGGSDALQPRTRTVHVSVVDAKGTPVIDLTAADFAVKEGGKAREIVKVEPASAPMQIMILIDDNGTGVFRSGVATFIQRLLGRGEFAISTVVGQVRKVVDFTASVESLSAAVNSLVARPGTPEGGQLLEGISEAAKMFAQREAARPVIVVLTVPGEEHSTLPAHHVLDQLRDSRAILEVISVAASALRATAAIEKPADMLDSNLNLHEVLGDGPKQSGGHREEIVATAGLLQGLQQMAEELKAQYAVSYTLPDGVKPDERLEVTTKRRGVTLRAPKRIPPR